MRGPAGAPAEHKEWFHFCVLQGELEVIANFSLMNGSPRVALIVRTGQEWHGDVENIPLEHAQWKRGSFELDFGQSSLRYTDRGFEISIALRDYPLTAQLILKPETLPLVRRNTAMEPGLIHWMVVPRLNARGRVIAGGKRWELEDAPAYHDHNWGNFAWGRGAWQWGFALPEYSRAREPDALALTFVRMLDRTRTRDNGHGLLFWRGAEQYRIFREGELTVSSLGYFRPKTLTKYPRAMALISPENCLEVPEKVAVVARGKQDEVEVLIESRDVVQVLVPNDLDLGVTAINEVSADYFVRGTIAGEAINFRGRGYFEVLTSSPGAKIAPGGAAQRAVRCEPPVGFAAFLRSSLEVLEAEQPGAYAAMCRVLQGLVVEVSVAGELVRLAFSPVQVFETESGFAPNVRLSTSAAVILELCDAKTTLASAVLADSLSLFGASQDLIRFDEGLTIYFAGALRCASFPELLHDYRAAQSR